MAQLASIRQISGQVWRGSAGEYQAANVYSGLIFFRIDWFDLLAVQDSQESSPIAWFKSILDY